MADVKVERAQRTFATLCRALTDMGLPFNKDEAQLIIECNARGEDLPMKIRVRVDPERQITTLISYIPFTVPQDKRFEMAIAISLVNNSLADGSFDYNIGEGDIFFRMTSSFIDSEVGDDVFKYMIACSFGTIDEYNDKFLMLNKGLIGIDYFMPKGN